jgi:hypothetical protein
VFAAALLPLQTPMSRTTLVSPRHPTMTRSRDDDPLIARSNRPVPTSDNPWADELTRPHERAALHSTISK